MVSLRAIVRAIYDSLFEEGVNQRVLRFRGIRLPRSDMSAAVLQCHARTFLPFDRNTITSCAIGIIHFVLDGKVSVVLRRK